ncbi:hypothetical protein D3C80_2075240 [compost metagenome]
MMIIICFQYINKFTIFPSQEQGIGRMCANSHIYEQCAGGWCALSEYSLNHSPVKRLVG